MMHGAQPIAITGPLLYNMSIGCKFSPARRGYGSSGMSHGFSKEASRCRIVKPTNVGIEYPVDAVLFKPHRDRIQRVVRVAAWSGAIREAHKLLLIYGVEHLDSRPLDDFVLQ